MARPLAFHLDRLRKSNFFVYVAHSVLENNNLTVKTYCPWSFLNSGADSDLPEAFFETGFGWVKLAWLHWVLSADLIIKLKTSQFPRRRWTSQIRGTFSGSMLSVIKCAFSRSLSITDRLKAWKHHMIHWSRFFTESVPPTIYLCLVE